MKKEALMKFELGQQLIDKLRKKKKIKHPQKISKCMSPESRKLWGEYIDAPCFEQKYEALTKNLDKTSLTLIELIIERLRFFYQTGKYSDKCYFYPEEWLSEEEINGEADVCKFDCARRYQNRLPVQFFEQSVLYFHSGLKLLPKSVLEYIENKDFIDGGACIGDSAMIFSEYNPNKVYAFEPIAENVEYIKKTIQINKLSKVVPVVLGLGSKNETIKITYNAANLGGSSSSLLLNGEERNIDIVTVDKYVEENNLNFGLLKLDVEGLESDIIAGSLNAIKKYRPVLIISIYHNAKDFFEIKPALENLDLDYKFIVRKLAYGSTYGETMLIAYPNELK